MLLEIINSKKFVELPNSLETTISTDVVCASVMWQVSSSFASQIILVRSVFSGMNWRVVLKVCCHISRLIKRKHNLFVVRKAMSSIK